MHKSDIFLQKDSNLKIKSLPYECNVSYQVPELLPPLPGCLPCEQLQIAMSALSSNEIVRKKEEKYTLPLDFTSTC